MGLKPNQNQTRHLRAAGGMNAAMIKRKKQQLRHGGAGAGTSNGGPNVDALADHADAEVLRVETAFSPVKPVRRYYHQKRAAQSLKKPIEEATPQEEDEENQDQQQQEEVRTISLARRKLKAKRPHSKEPVAGAATASCENQPPNQRHATPPIHPGSATHAPTNLNQMDEDSAVAKRSHKRKNPKSSLHRTELYRNRKHSQSQSQHSMEDSEDNTSVVSGVGASSGGSEASYSSNNAKEKENAPTKPEAMRRRKRHDKDPLDHDLEQQDHPNQHQTHQQSQPHHKHKYSSKADKPMASAPVQHLHPSHNVKPSDTNANANVNAPAPSKSKPLASVKKKKFGKKTSRSFRPLEVWKAKVPLVVDPPPSASANNSRVKQQPVVQPHPTVHHHHHNNNNQDEEDLTGEEVEPEVDEEQKFADDKRRSLKQGSDIFFQKTRESIQRCTKSVQCECECEAFPVESSSQETQSGSEDEGPLTVHPFDVLPNSSSATSSSVPPMALVDDRVMMVSPFPLDLLSVPWANWNVHEVLLENFEFRPCFLQVEASDVVVWRVSEQTLGMVEHCLNIEATRVDERGLLVLDQHVSVVSPLLSGGSVFALRFGQCCRVEVHCTVYQLSGAVEVLPKRVDMAADFVDKEQLSVPGAPVVESDDQSPDAGAMELVDQSTTTEKADGVAFFMVGDVACPYPVAWNQEVVATEIQVEAQQPNDEQVFVESNGLDFQDQIISMLKKSEESQTINRKSFVVPQGSGFDAERAYDFFKRRFAQLQLEDRALVYCQCIEMTSRAWN